MAATARPISSFSRFETGRNDVRDADWEQRLKPNMAAGVMIRPCLPPDQHDGIYISELELVARVLAGDLDAEEWFVSRFERLVAGIVRTLPVPPQERSDVCQQVYFNLWDHEKMRLRAWHSSRRGRLTSYLATIIRRTAFDWIRESRRADRLIGSGNAPAEYRRPIRVAELPSRTEEDAGDHMTPEALVIQREKRRAIRRTVTHLLRRDCELLTRRYFRGESIQQIAGAMRMTENHVYVAIHRAEKRMENKLRLNNPGLFD